MAFAEDDITARRRRLTELFKDDKTESLREAFCDRDPFSTGVSIVPDHQLLLYYTQADQNRDGSQACRIDFSKCTNEDLAELYRACTPASFGRNQETVIDATYRKAGKMDLDTFSTQFDPRSLGIHEKIAKGFLCLDNVEMELYKLNVYGRCFTIDFSEQFAAATSPSICFVAFFGDVDHEVLPVSSGYRVTLTYNLYAISSNASASYIPTRFHEKLKGALIDLLNDETKLPNGGYLGFGLVHKYVYDDSETVDTLVNQFKGSDKALAQICEELSLPFSIRLLYRDIEIDFDSRGEKCPFLVDRRLRIDGGGNEDDDPLRNALTERGFTINQVEGINLVGGYQVDTAHLVDYLDFLKPFYRVPVTQILEISAMSSVQAATQMVYYGNEVVLEHTYGSACMLVKIKPVESREKLVL